MPLGILRLNAQKTQPNDRIVFIKPLKGSDEATAQHFLERIAAQCLPIMRAHHLSVTTLEEHEPNREFVGRNFNGGEIIQLVLRARCGRWLPFPYVQMVMMHELAHCVHMNHSRAFWAVRSLYAEQMRRLWACAYTGEGMWGRGAALGTGEFEADDVVAPEHLPEHLCGGTFRSRPRKRKGQGKGKGACDASYQEKKRRRIEKKFGRNGVALGADDAVKARLEKGKRTQAAPRVAGSNRGRELRAAAALARFAEKKQEAEQEGDEDGSDESDCDDAEDPDLGAADALDIDGRTMRDRKGNRMVKICDDENPDDEDAANERQELQSSITAFFGPTKREDKESREGLGLRADHTLAEEAPRREANPDVAHAAIPDEQYPGGGKAQTPPIKKEEDTAEPLRLQPSKPPPRKSVSSKPSQASRPPPRPLQKGTSCPVCSFENDAYIVTCGMCSHVLDADSVPGAWSCQSPSCQGGLFLNAGDCGTCGLCGQRKSAAGDQGG